MKLNQFKILIALFIAFFVPLNVSAEIVALHEGLSDPGLEEGWTNPTPVNGITDEAVTDTEPAWKVYDNASYVGGGHTYQYALTDEEFNTSMSEGWNLKTRLKVLGASDNVDYSVSVWFDTGAGKRFVMVFGTAANGDPQVRLVTSSSGSATFGPTRTVTGGAGKYNDYELVYNPISQRAGLLINGVAYSELTEYAGWNIASSGKFVAFGSGSSFDTGSANYARVEFENISNSSSLPFVHLDNTDPIGEGWGGTGERSQVITEGIVNDNGVNAWKVHDNASYINGAKNYWKSLTDAQINTLMTEGWKLSTRLRVVAPCDTNSSASCFDETDFGIATWFDAGPGKRFAMVFGRTVAGDPEVQLLTSASSSGTSGPSYVVTDSTANDYYLYELVYDPVSQTADLYVDQSEDPVIENFAGWNLSTAGKRFTWGSGSSHDTGSANYSFVELKSNAVVNTEPTAVAGIDQSIHAGDLVTLDGSASFDDQTASVDLIYTWSFTSKPAGSTAALSDSGAIAPTFTADLPGTYVLELIVTDEGGLDSPVDVVEVSSLNMAPTADAGTGVIVGIGDTAILNGVGSFDPDGDAITYQWAITSAPNGSTATIVNTASQVTSIVPDLEGQYVISLVVSDPYSSSPADTVTVTVIGPEFAEDRLMDGSDIISALPDSDFDAKGHRNSLVNRIADVITAIQAGMLEEARNDLEAIIERVDGCTLRGTADPKGGGQAFAADYITDCTEQEDVYDILIEALDAIS